MKTINLPGVCAGYGLHLMACLLIPSFGLTRAQRPASAVNVSEEYLKSAADQERAALGLPPLRFDAALSAAARRHALLMVQHNSISHRYSEEPDLANRASEAGARFSRITENVAQAPSAILVHTAWMHSEGHRHNLLDPKVDSVGISVISRNGQMFAVEDFAHSVALLSLRQQEEAVAGVVRASGVTVEIPGEDARQVCAGSAIAEMSSSPEFVMRYTTDDLKVLPTDLTTRLRSGRYSRAIVVACAMEGKPEFSLYRVAVFLYRGGQSGE